MNETHITLLFTPFNNILLSCDLIQFIIKIVNNSRLKLLQIEKWFITLLTLYIWPQKNRLLFSDNKNSHALF